MGRWRFFKLPEYFLEKRTNTVFLLFFFFPSKKSWKKFVFLLFYVIYQRNLWFWLELSFFFILKDSLETDTMGCVWIFAPIFFCRSRQSSIIINSQIYVKVHDFNLETLYANYALKTRLLHAYIILFDANLSRWLDIEVTFWSLIEKKSCKIWFFKLK